MATCTVSLTTTSVVFLMMVMKTTSQLHNIVQPMNITRTAGDMFVFIPCPYETSSTPSIWRINGTDYTAATLPSMYSLAPGGLFIITVHICLDQVPFQCIDISGNSLQEDVSQIGVLTVISPTGENCTDDAMRDYFSSGTDAMGFELDHRRMEYSSVNTTFAWKISPPGSECNISRILSYPDDECQLSNPDINMTTSDTTFTVPSTSLYISEQLADFNLSSSSEQESVQCEGLEDTVRIRVNHTETVNVLLGANNCSCARLESLNDLYFAVSNPDPDELDVTCPIYARGNSCYSPDRCSGFTMANITAFFRICKNTSDSSFSLCSSNVTKQLNGSRLEFYTLTIPTCTLYFARTYIRSFEFNVARASSNIEANVASRQICFSSSTDCSLANLTQYSVEIIDISGNTIFERDEISESTCLTVNELRLLPQCGPFTVSTKPMNDYIVYDSDIQEIPSGTEEQPTLSSCFEASVQLRLDAMYDSQNSSIELNIQCSTVYITPIYITIMDRNGFSNQTRYSCINETLQIAPTSGCGEIRLCGYFTFNNGSVVTDISLNCSNSVEVPCPSPPTPTTQPSHPLSGGAIVGIVIGSIIIILTAAILIAVIITVLRRRNRHGSMNVTATYQRNGSNVGETTSDSRTRLPDGDSVSADEDG